MASALTTSRVQLRSGVKVQRAGRKLAVAPKAISDVNLIVGGCTGERHVGAPACSGSHPAFRAHHSSQTLDNMSFVSCSRCPGPGEVSAAAGAA